MNWALAIDWIAERIDNPAKQPLADRHINDGAGPLDRLAFPDVAVAAEDDDTDIVALEVQRHAAHAVLELDHLAGLDVVESIDAGDTIPNREDLAYLGYFCFIAEVRDFLFRIAEISAARISISRPLSCVCESN